MKGSIAAALLAIGVPASCVEPRSDIAACEAHIQKGLLSPSSYKRISSFENDGPSMTAKEFVKAAGMVTPRKSDPDWELWHIEQTIVENHRLALRDLVIEYDAQNASGVAIRNKALCAFRLVDGQLESEETLMRRATSSNDEALQMLASLGGMKPRRKPRYDCCL